MTDPAQRSPLDRSRREPREGNISLLHHAVILSGAFFLLNLIPSDLSGQSVFGRTLLRGDTLAIEGVGLSLVNAADSTVAQVTSDDLGRFRLPAPAGGAFRIRASRIGYAAVEAEVVVRDAESLEVELRMAPEAIPLDPILVVGRREVEKGTIEEFYDRMARMKQAGKGQFMTREQIEARKSLNLGLIMNTIPGVWTQGMNGTPRLLKSSPRGRGVFCSPEFFLDGQPMLGGFRSFVPDDLEGIEVYRGYGEAVPGEFPDECGQVFLWRRPDWGNPITWGRTFAAVGLGAVVWFLTSLIGG
ncbi:MAG: TonB-dependent receptor [Gemmatimonadetes bacterium]|nr:TonB-dependent receptor [Gemmatimonadota bacterium]